MERAHERRLRERGEARTWQEKATTYFREKQNAGMGPTSGTVGVLEEKRTGNERKERDDEREKTQVPAESRDITLAMPSQHRDVLQPRRRTCARFIGQRAENLYGDSHWQVVLLAMKNRNFSLTLPPIILLCLLSRSLSLCFSRDSNGAQETGGSSETSC